MGQKILKIFLILILTIFLSLIIFITYTISSYRSWQKDFEGNIPSQELVTSIDVDDEKTLKKKIEHMTSSINNTVILEISTTEVSSLILDSFQGNEFFDINAVYIEPMEKGRWDIYLKTNFLEKISVWVEIKVRKENRETAEIFAEDILVGPFALKSFGLSNLVGRVNEALSFALITVEENGFVGRTLENIELLDSGMIIRLEKY